MEEPDGAAEARSRVAAAHEARAESLSLADLGLSRLPPELANLGNLKTLDLSGNALRTFPDWFANLAALRSLDLSGNALEELPRSLAALVALETLLLRGNRLVTAPPWLSALKRLSHLDLADNRLVELPASLAGLSALTRLDVRGNRHLILPPPDVVAQGTEAVLGYLLGLDGGNAPWEPPASPASFPLPASASQEAVASSAGAIAGGRSAGLRIAGFRVGAVAVAAVVLFGTATAVVVAGDAGRGKEHKAGVAADGIGTSTANPHAAAVPSIFSTRDVSLLASPTSSKPASSPKATPTATAASPSATATAPATAPLQPPPPAPPAPPATSAAPPAQQPLYVTAPPNVDLAQGRPAQATSVEQNYGPGNAVDGDVNSYWESADSSGFPQVFEVDLGSVTTVGRLEFDLPRYPWSWNQRTQTIAVQGAGNDGAFTTIVGLRDYAFDVRTGDTTGVSFSPVHVRYLRLVFTANDGWPAAQLSELKAFS
jgi:hypothetical protein